MLTIFLNVVDESISTTPFVFMLPKIVAQAYELPKLA